MIIGITEDSRTYRNSLIEKLNASGRVQLAIEATNGKEFLEQMKKLPAQKRPAVVLMDIEMPELDGIQTVAAASELYPETRFIMLTSFDEDDKIFEAIRAGAAGYLLKDETTERILDAIFSVEEGAPMSPRIARKTLNLLKASPSSAKTENNQSGLSEREMAILELLVDGYNYHHIGEKLFISPLTVKKHVQNIYGKLHVNSKVSAVKLAIKKGWFGR